MHFAIERRKKKRTQTHSSNEYLSNIKYSVCIPFFTIPFLCQWRKNFVQTNLLILNLCLSLLRLRCSTRSELKDLNKLQSISKLMLFFQFAQGFDIHRSGKDCVLSFKCIDFLGHFFFRSLLLFVSLLLCEPREKEFHRCGLDGGGEAWTWARANREQKVKKKKKYRTEAKRVTWFPFPWILKRENCFSNCFSCFLLPHRAFGHYAIYRAKVAKNFSTIARCKYNMNNGKTQEEVEKK